MHKKNKYLFWTISAISIIVLWLFQYKISSNIPWWDDFYGIVLPVYHLFSDIPLLEKIQQFFSLNNEHRVVNDRFFLLIIYLISGSFELKTLALLGFLNLILIFGLIFKISKPLVSNLLYLIPIPLLIFHAQYYESLQSLMVPFQNFSVILYVFLSFYYLIYKKINSLLPAYIFALLAIFSHGNGILAFLIGIIILAFGQRKKDLIIWTILSLLTISLYFIGYSKPEWSSGVSAFSQPIAAIRYTFEFLGAYALNITDLSTTLKNSYGEIISEIFGLFLVLTFVALFLIKYPLFSSKKSDAFKKLRHSKTDQFIICVFGFVFATGIMIGLSRTGFSMLSRYTINSSFLVIAVYLFVISNIKQKRIVGNITVALTFMMLIFSYLNNYDIALYNRKNLVADGINFQKTGQWSNQYSDSTHISKLKYLLLEPYKSGKYKFPISILDNYETLESKISREVLNYGINDGYLEISGSTEEFINYNNGENGIYFSLENAKNNFIFPARQQSNNILGLIKSQKYYSDLFRTTYPVKLIPRAEYRIYKLIVNGAQVTKYDLNKTYGSNALIR